MQTLHAQDLLSLQVEVSYYWMNGRNTALLYEDRQGYFLLIHTYEALKVLSHIYKCFCCSRSVLPSSLLKL